MFIHITKLDVIEPLVRVEKEKTIPCFSHIKWTTAKKKEINYKYSEVLLNLVKEVMLMKSHKFVIRCTDLHFYKGDEFEQTVICFLVDEPLLQWKLLLEGRICF